MAIETRDQRPRVRRKTAECRDLLLLNWQLVEADPQIWYSTTALEYGDFLSHTRNELERWRQRLSERQA